ncbi:MAG: glycosyltransferase family 4 protein [Nitrososphaeraceae archaeon]
MNKRLHICIMCSERIFEVTCGGTERFTICLGKWLYEKGYNITLVGSGYLSRVKVKHNEEIFQNMPSSEIVHVSYHITLLSSLILIPWWILKIIFIHRNDPISLIHVQDTGYAAIAAVIAAKFLKIPIILTSHGTRQEIFKFRLKGTVNKLFLKLERCIDILTIKNATNVSVQNEAMKKHFEQLFSRTIDILPIPIKCRNFQFSESNRHSVREELGVGEKEILVGYIGRFSSEKNIFSLVNAFISTTNSHRLIKLVLVGSGQQECEIKRIINKSTIQNRVIFLGIRYDIGRILSGIDIFVLPSYTEGMSTALLEAMACGRSIIASNIPANRDLLVPNKEAIMIDPYKQDELERAIYLLTQDSSLRIQLGENSKVKVSKFDEEIIFSNLICYYNSVICKNTSKSLRT